MRGLFPIFGVGTLLWGFVQAPFDHVHAEDLDHEHGAGIAHTHFHGIHEDTGPEIEPLTADDDAVDVVWSISAPQTTQLKVPFTVAERLVVHAPAEASANAPSMELHSHDPPSARPQQSRAPPA